MVVAVFFATTKVVELAVGVVVSVDFDVGVVVFVIFTKTSDPLPSSLTNKVLFLSVLTSAVVVVVLLLFSTVSKLMVVVVAVVVEAVVDLA